MWKMEDYLYIYDIHAYICIYNKYVTYIYIHTHIYIYIYIYYACPASLIFEYFVGFLSPHSSI